MPEIPGDFAFRPDATLESLEAGIRAVRYDVATYRALLAAALGRILIERLFLRVAPSFKAYILRERTGITYAAAHKLATAGARWWTFRGEFEEHGIDFADHVSKTGLIDIAVARTDPMYWERFPSLTARGLVEYQERRRPDRNVYSATLGQAGMIIAKGARLSIDGHVLRGLNLNEARRNVLSGKRLVPVWVDDDLEARRVRRRLAL